ncbi:MAG: hypothetical protein IJX14_04155 [Clostridia bacterium]|nr:hypothetical protein [Clostridia bacterium]
MEFFSALQRYFAYLAEYIRNYTFSEFWSDHLSYWIPAILANLTVTGSVVILAVLLLRLLYRRCRLERFLPYWTVYALWAVVLVRLLCPIAIPTPVSLFGLFDTPVSETGSLNYIPTAIVHEEYPMVSLPVPDAVNQVLTDALPSGLNQTIGDPLEWEMFLLSSLWHLGAYTVLLVGLIRLRCLRRRLREAVYIGLTGKDDRVPVFLADRIDTPFVLGLFRPKIYLPSVPELTDAEREHILLHENCHIRRGDLVWKTIGFACLCIHWFNPLVWLVLRTAEKDMEISCDQRVLREMEKSGAAGTDAMRLAYTETLLKMASPVKSLSLLPVAFGESGTGERIRRLVGYRKPMVWGIAAAVVMVVLSAALLATNPAEDPVTVLVGADYKAVQVVYAREKESIPADAPTIRITPDRHLMMIDTVNYKEFGVLSPCNGTYEWDGDGYVTHEAVTLEMLRACRKWPDAYDRTGRIRPITDAWGLRGEDPGTWYLAFQTRGGKTYLASGTTDADGSGILQEIIELKSTFDRKEDVSRIASYAEAMQQISMENGLGAVQYYAEYSDARIPESFLLGFRAYPATGKRTPQMLGYAHFHVYDTGVVLDTVHVYDAPEGYVIAPHMLWYGDDYCHVVLTYQCDGISEILVTREDGTKERYGMEYSKTGIELIPSRNGNWADIVDWEVNFSQERTG